MSTCQYEYFIQGRVRATDPDEAHEKVAQQITRRGYVPVRVTLKEVMPGWWEYCCKIAGGKIDGDLGRRS